MDAHERLLQVKYAKMLAVSNSLRLRDEEAMSQGQREWLMMKTSLRSTTLTSEESLGRREHHASRDGERCRSTARLGCGSLPSARIYCAQSKMCNLWDSYGVAEAYLGLTRESVDFVPNLTRWNLLRIMQGRPQPKPFATAFLWFEQGNHYGRRNITSACAGRLASIDIRRAGPDCLYRVPNLP